MNAHQRRLKTEGQNSTSAAAAFSAPQANALKDNRPGAKINATLTDNRTLQAKVNNTGLPDQLKAGVENLSGHSLDDVNVHYNSSKPAQLQAHAFAQGNQIHIAPGQQKHLPHEAWHVVQQKQGRVKPTVQLKGDASVNDDKALENEADAMGFKAAELKNAGQKTKAYNGSRLNHGVVQKANAGTIQLARFKAVDKLGKYEWESLDGFAILPGFAPTKDEIGKIWDDQLKKWEISDDDFKMHHDTYKKDMMDVGDAPYKKLKRQASFEMEKNIPAIPKWRQDKKSSLSIEVDKKSKTLQGTGYFVKGGSDYENELSHLMEAIKKDHATATDDELHTMANHEINQGLMAKSKYPEANGFGVINLLGEGSRASFSPFVTSILTNSEKNKKTNPKKIIREKTSFGKGIPKSANAWLKERNKMIAARKNKKNNKLTDTEIEAEVDESIKTKKTWESKTQSGVGGSKQSQYGTDRQDKKLKRQGSFEMRINNEKQALLDEVEELRKNDKTSLPEDLLVNKMKDHFSELGKNMGPLFK